MTQEPDKNLDAALEAALHTARANPPAPEAHLLARIEAAGLEAQTRMHKPRAGRPSGFAWPDWSALRLWSAASALAACLVLGIGLGAQFDSELTTLTDLYIEDTAAAETVLWSFDLALEGGV